MSVADSSSRLCLSPSAHAELSGSLHKARAREEGSDNSRCCHEDGGRERKCRAAQQSTLAPAAPAATPEDEEDEEAEAEAEEEEERRGSRA